MNKAIIGLGSNIDPKKNISQARQLIADHYKMLKESSFVQTKPVGYVDQDDFINGSIYIETQLNYDQLKANLKIFENQLGRTGSPIKNGPRTIDLDIIIWNEKVKDKDFYERDFLRESVLELIPHLSY